MHCGYHPRVSTFVLTLGACDREIFQLRVGSKAYATGASGLPSTRPEDVPTDGSDVSMMELKILVDQVAWAFALATEEAILSYLATVGKSLWDLTRVDDFTCITISV
jgi:hypothetical protein